MKMVRVENRNLQQQMANAHDLMARYIEYAKRIGCEVCGDSVACSAKQAELLTTWWNREAAK